LAAIGSAELAQRAVEVAAGGGRSVMSRWLIGIGMGSQKRSG
jgi:hypothetical protein